MLARLSVFRARAVVLAPLLAVADFVRFFNLASRAPSVQAAHT